ncbi:MAG: glycosyltransferase family 39 protein [Candidatus Omnitrophota bacterium]
MSANVPERMKNAAKQKKYLVLVWALLFLISASYLFCRYKITDEALFGGDTWSYQSLAVNLVSGHGYTFGEVEDLATYKFDEKARERFYYKKFVEEAGLSFGRTPVYPFFLASIYKSFGIHPKYVKFVQLAMLAVSISLMPLIGLYYWSRTGFISGVAGAILFVKYFCPDPNLIMAEPLLLFTMVLWTVSFIYWERSRNKRRTFLMGVMSALVVLTKGTTIFLPFLFLLYLIYKRRKGQKKVAAVVTAFILGISLLVLPWSIYASMKSGKFIILSTQGGNIILDGNNEDSIETGTWEPRWRKEGAGNMKYSHNRLEGSGYPAIAKVLIFMRQNTSKLPKLFKNKIVAGFRGESVYVSVLGMLLYYFISIFRREKVPVFPMLFFLNLLLLILIMFGYYRHVTVFMYFILVPASYLPFYLVKQASLLTKGKNSVYF